jgi:hypothetical protein
MALRLDWSEERYARIYCRDTLDWQCLSWNAQALWTALNRKATRSGRIDLGRSGLRGVPALVGRPDMPQLMQAMDELLADGCVVLEGDVLVIPDFVEAQEAVSSGAKRMRELRERRREEDALANGDRLPDGELPAREVGGTEPGKGSPKAPLGPSPMTAESPVTPTSRRVTERNAGDESSQNVTRGYSTEREARHGAPGGPQGDALSTTFAAELEAEASEDDVRKGRVLAAMGAEWRTPYEIAVALQGRRKRPDVDAVVRDLAELQRRGLVERAERGAPPVTHWHVHAVATAVASEDAA